MFLEQWVNDFGRLGDLHFKYSVHISTLPCIICLARCAEVSGNHSHILLIFWNCFISLEGTYDWKEEFERKSVNRFLKTVENSPFRGSRCTLSQRDVFWMLSQPSVEGGSLIIHASDKEDNFDVICPSLQTLFLENGVLAWSNHYIVSELAITSMYIVKSLFMVLF